jgi:predicted RNase H-like HicB family nuclease
VAFVSSWCNAFTPAWSAWDDVWRSVTICAMSEFTVDIDREEDGRWIGEVAELPGVLTYGATREEAVAKAKALAFRVLADRLEHGEEIPEIHGVFAVSG